MGNGEEEGPPPMRLVMNEPVERMDRPYPRRWWALLVLCLSLLIIVMANTALTVAAPDMTRDLGLTSADLQWVIDGYTVPYAALMLRHLRNGPGHLWRLWRAWRGLPDLGRASVSAVSRASQRLAGPGQEHEES